MNKDTFGKLNMYRLTYVTKEGDVYIRRNVDIEGYTPAHVRENFRDYIIETLNKLPNEVTLINAKKLEKPKNMRLN